MEKKSEKVILVTVTYNSSGYLRKLVNAVSNQSVPLYKIVISDNASSEEHKKNLKELLDSHNNIDILSLEKNVGGAGGFSRGMKYAVEKYPEADWIWIMDDDAYPEIDALEKLLDCACKNEVEAICPVIKGIETGDYQIYHHKFESKYLNRDIPAFEDKDILDEITKIDANSFVGPLMKRELIRRMGYPDEQLFIEGDDTDYTYNISRNCGLYLCRDAEVNHRDLVDNTGKVDSKGLWKTYYHCRNRILFIRKYAKTTNARLLGEALYIKNTLGSVYTTFKEKSYSGIRSERIRLFKLGIVDGLRGIKGKSLDPKEYVQKLKQ